MSLNLDPRQRAMLEAMHIKLWQPEPVVCRLRLWLLLKR